MNKKSGIAGIADLKFSITLARSNRSMVELTELYNQLGNQYRIQGNYKKALKAHQEEYELCKEFNSGDKMSIGIACRNLAECLLELKMPSNAEKYACMHLGIAKAAGHFLEEQRAYITLGRVYLLKTDLEECPEESRTPLKTGSKSSLALESAIKSFRSALQLLGNPKLRAALKNRKELMYMACTNYQNLGIALESQGKLLEATSYLRQAVAVGDQWRFFENLASCYSVLSEIFIKQKNWKEAEDAADRAAASAKAAGNGALEIENLLVKAKILFRNGEAGAGKRILKKLRLRVKPKPELQVYLHEIDPLLCSALRITRAQRSLLESDKDDLEQKMKSHEVLGDNYSALKAFDIALANYMKACELAESAKVEGKQLAKFYFSIAETYKDLQDYKRALDYYRLEMRANSHNSADGVDTETGQGSVLSQGDNSINLDNLSVDSEEEEDVDNKAMKTKVAVRVNDVGENRLHIAARKGNLSLVRELICKGHPVNVTDFAGWTPLHEACNFGHAEVVEELLKNGADVNHSGGSQTEKVTPLHDAAMNCHCETIKVLLKHGANVLARDSKEKYPIDSLLEWRESDAAKEVSKDELVAYQEVKVLLKEQMAIAGIPYLEEDEQSSRKQAISKLSNGNPGQSSHLVRQEVKQIAEPNEELAIRPISRGPRGALTTSGKVFSQRQENPVLADSTRLTSSRKPGVSSSTKRKHSPVDDNPLGSPATKKNAGSQRCAHEDGCSRMKVGEGLREHVSRVVDRYRAACKNADVALNPVIESSLRKCELSNVLNLMDVTLVNCSSLVIGAVHQQTALRELVLSGCALSDPGINELCKALPTLPSLVKLDLSSNDLTKTGLAAFAEAFSKKYGQDAGAQEPATATPAVPLVLSTLVLSDNPLGNQSGATFANLLAKLPALRRLELSNCGFSKELFISEQNELCKALKDSKLEELDISFNDLKDVGLATLLESLPAQKILSLNCSSCSSSSDDGLASTLCNFISGNKEFCNLHTLQLNNCGFTDESIDLLLSNHERLKKLECLELGYNEQLKAQSLLNILTWCVEQEIPLTRLDMGCIAKFWQSTRGIRKNILFAIHECRARNLLTNLRLPMYEKKSKSGNEEISLSEKNIAKVMSGEDEKYSAFFVKHNGCIRYFSEAEN